MARDSLTHMARKARQAAADLATAPTAQKNSALEKMAALLRRKKKRLLLANAKDLRLAKTKKISRALLDRLALDETKIELMARGIEEVARLADPVGQVIARWQRPNGLEVCKVRIPIGVICMIYEARPNVTSDAAALCIKSGNAVILRGGREAFASNQAIARLIGKALAEADLPRSAVQMPPSPDRRALDRLLRMENDIDLVIPRGGEGLIRHVSRFARMPVLKHYKGVCHLYVDETADEEMAVAIALNAKVERPGVCNAMETLLVHRRHQHQLLPRLVAALQKNGVEIRATPEIVRLCPGTKKARPTDFGREFLDLILAVKLVDSLEGAIDHIRQFGSSHTEAIVTRSPENASRFQREVQSGVVLVNASTRFADGGELGMGAEVGISTSKIHAFGPMGLEDLTIAHYLVHGTGQVRDSRQSAPAD